MGLIADCNTYFGTLCLYQVLAVEKTATEAQLKKAYKKASLLTHPDKVSEDQKEAATRKFQLISKVHFILSDPERRALYDESGIVDEEDAIGSSEFDYWSNYFRVLFPKITTKDIDNFMNKYKGSGEEIEDLIKCYVEFEGDMDVISEYLIGYDFNEESYYCDIINEKIENGEIPSFPKFVKETSKKKAARQKRHKRETISFNKLATGKSNKSEYSFTNRRQIREENFNSMISNLVAKYGTQEFVEDDVSKLDFEECKTRSFDRKFKKENVEADKCKTSADDDLINQIAQRRKQRESQFNSLIASLEAKYAKEPKKKKR